MTCSKCNGAGYLRNKHGDYTQCECMLRAEREEAVKRLIPKRYHQCTLRNFKKTKCKSITKNNESTRKFITVPEDLNEDTSYIFMGDPRTGKTHLLVSLFKQDIQNGVRAFFAKEIDLLMEAQRRQNSSGGHIIDAVSDFEAVYIDDLGKSTVSDFRSQELFYLLDWIQDECIKFRFSTNMVGPDRNWLLPKHSESAWSRMIYNSTQIYTGNRPYEDPTIQ